jgi:photosystem II stability/assembly factor-like uncharacterized protein
VAAGALLVLLLSAALVQRGWPMLATAPPQWRAVASPHTVVYALVRTPCGPLYAATDMGVYASVDGGGTWRAARQGMPQSLPAVWALTAVPAPHAALLAASITGALHRLACGGVHWLPAGRPWPAQATYALFALPASAAVLAGTGGGIARSCDGGRSWTRVAATPGDAVVAFARDPADGTLYAGVSGHGPSLRLSTDGGRTWRIPATKIPSRSVVALLATPQRVYAGVMGAPGGQAVWVGGPGGFTPLSVGLPGDAHGMALVLLTGDRLAVGTMGVGVYSRKRTGRGMWRPLGQGPGDGIVTALLVVPGAAPALLAGTDSGIYRWQAP